MNSSWFLWFMVMFVLLVPPLGYGWGYRGWGAPYPRYIQRRRAPKAADNSSSGTPHHLSWGWGGDFVWAVFFFGMLWMVTAMWLPVWSH
jgi:hypothetical protein